MIRKAQQMKIRNSIMEGRKKKREDRTETKVGRNTEKRINK